MKTRARFRQCTTLLILAVLVTELFTPILTMVWPIAAEAAQVTIDPQAGAAGTSHLQTGGQTVFTSDQNGYKFYRDANGSCVYRKTTDGGTTWSSTTTVDARTNCIAIQVWYDQWTPGLTASSGIHIVTLDTTLDDIFYNRLDTSGDTLLLGSAPVSMVTNPAQGGTITEGQNLPSITRGTDGTIYAVNDDNTDSYVVECTVSCNVAANWTETGTNPLQNANDYNILVPLTGGNIMLINRDISAEDIRVKTWDNSAWSVSWTTIDANATDNTAYDGGLAAAVSSTTPGVVYLAYTADNDTLGTNDDVRVAWYNGTSWATSTDVISGSATRAITGVSIGLDLGSNEVYVAYTARTTSGTAGTGNVYWKRSTSTMSVWSQEYGPVNTTADDLYGVDLSRMSDERMYVTYFDNTDDDIYGDTIANIFPGVYASSTGTQTTNVQASTTNVYIGGGFLIYNNYWGRSFDLTGITITESGTIDGSTGIANVKLLYEMDTAAPYDCATNTYNGTESQFGSTDTNGFSGPNGTASFTGTTVSLSTSTAMCVYVVIDVLKEAGSATTIDISIDDPSTDITVTDAPTGPTTPQNIASTTLVYNDYPTQTHYHWRNDNGTEVTATSKTGGVEDTALTSMQIGSTTRLRIAVSNEGSTSTGQMQYQLEYSTTEGSCDAATGWTAVSATGDFMPSNSANLTEGSNTTNIALGSQGAVSDPSGKSFLTPNGGVRDTTSITGNVNLSPTQFVELEYSLMASSSVVEGTSYCFRVTNAGAPLSAYTNLARANINADVFVAIATTSQVSTANIPATNFYVGSSFVITDITGTSTVTSITISEQGSVDAQTELDNIKLYYDLDTTNPYNCGGETYTGGELQFGTTDADGFSGPNGTSTFTGSVVISTTTAMCVYVVLDSAGTAQNGDTIDIIMENPSVNLTVDEGTVSPTVTRNMNGSTTLVGPVLTQTHYHWRSDNGSEAAATSLTGGSEDTSVTNVAQTTPVRLRLQVSNEGGVTSVSKPFTLEYGAKISTCGAISTWYDVGATGGAWDMFDSTNLTEGANTTNIAVSTGGVTDENTTFLTPNSAVKDTSSTVASTSLTSSQYLEAEYSIKQTTDAGYDTTYCFRVVQNGNPIDAYTNYPELTTAPERDFEIQRNTVTISGTSVTLVAGTDYIAPAASTSAFIRITNTSHTGAGDNSLGGTQNADDVTAYIVNPSNILTSVTIARPSTAISNTRVSWEIVEFIGEPGSDNEMIVRSQTSFAYGSTATTATGTSVSVSDDSDVVVFITGQANPDTGVTNYTSGLSTSDWNYANDVPVFTRGDAGGDASLVSYAVVEFTGLNWLIQRSEHTYAAAGITETEPITSVNSLSRTFLHAQKRNGRNATGTDEFGHEVWLSSIGYVSYFLESGATLPSQQTAVAWIMENIQTSSGAMEVTRPPQGSSNGGAEPLTISASITKTLTDLTNTSIFGTSRSAGTGTLFPRPIAGLTIASTTHYEVWRSDTGANLTYRVEIVEWPTAGLALKQNYYRFYVDNNALLPTDPWPAGGTDLGENTAITATDDPLGEGERLRLRMTLRVVNATLPTTTRAFRLQFAPLVTTCSAVAESGWSTLGNQASSTIWRGYAATGTTDGTALSGNPHTPGDLLISVAQQTVDVAGTLEEINDSEPNPYSVPEGSDMEYDWFVEQNGATAETFYCFRMVESDGTPLAQYLYYPQVRTASFEARTQDWRWFGDEDKLTPTSTLAEYNTAPTGIVSGNPIVLRVTVKEVNNIARNDVRFKLQYSEYADFSTSTDVLATTSCTYATATWCYADGAGTDNGKVSSTTLTDVDSCVAGVGDGCGVYNKSPAYYTGFRHENGAAAEYSFTIKSSYPRVDTVYYFRLYDLIQGVPVLPNTGETYPSVVTEGASLTFTIAGIASSTVTEGVTTKLATTPTSVPFGRLAIGTDYEAAQRITVVTNAPEGYQVYLTTGSDLVSSAGSTIDPITSTNASPVGWSTACDTEAPGCFGYHAGDDTLEGGSARFAANDTYARFSTTTLDEVVYGGGPTTGDTIDMVYRVKARSMQEAGQYVTNLRYIAVPVF